MNIILSFFTNFVYQLIDKHLTMMRGKSKTTGRLHSFYLLYKERRDYQSWNEDSRQNRRLGLMNAEGISFNIFYLDY